MVRAETESSFVRNALAFCGRARIDNNLNERNNKNNDNTNTMEMECKGNRKLTHKIYIVIRICPVILSFVCVKSPEMCVLDENIMRRRRKLIFGTFGLHRFSIMRSMFVV